MALVRLVVFLLSILTVLPLVVFGIMHAVALSKYNQAFGSKKVTETVLRQSLERNAPESSTKMDFSKSNKIIYSDNQSGYLTDSSKDYYKDKVSKIIEETKEDRESPSDGKAYLKIDENTGADSENVKLESIAIFYPGTISGLSQEDIITYFQNEINNLNLSEDMAKGYTITYHTFDKDRQILVYIEATHLPKH